MMNFFKKYPLSELCYLAICVLRSKIISANIRLIRFPIQIRNRSKIKFGKGFTTGVGCRLEVEGGQDSEYCLTIGNKVQINDYVHITAAKSVIIANNVLIASKVYISDCSHGLYSGKEGQKQDTPFSAPIERNIVSNPVVIEDNVWIGENVCVLPGVTIGKGSIIGANAVVTKSIDPCCIAAGNPAKVIKRYSFEKKQWLREV